MNTTYVTNFDVCQYTVSVGGNIFRTVKMDFICPETLDLYEFIKRLEDIIIKNNLILIDICDQWSHQRTMLGYSVKVGNLLIQVERYGHILDFKDLKSKPKEFFRKTFPWKEIEELVLDQLLVKPINDWDELMTVLDTFRDKET